MSPVSPSGARHRHTSEPVTYGSVRYSWTFARGTAFLMYPNESIATRALLSKQMPLATVEQELAALKKKLAQKKLREATLGSDIKSLSQALVQAKKAGVEQALVSSASAALLTFFE